MSAPAVLVARTAPAVADRLARSAAAPEGSHTATAAVPGWLAAHRRAGGAVVRRIPFAELEHWSFAPRTGNLHHSSGRFFTIEGLHADGPDGTWQQPIIVQPEIGILGILAKEFDGVLHFLMQAKMEPGNPNLVQLSPTVQATRSNYTQAHGGSAVKYLEHFLSPPPGQVLTDVLQSEHGAWFYRKRNRNMIVEVGADVDVAVDDAFCWLTLGQLARLLRLDNVVNMDARTVLASAPFPSSAPRALSSDAELLAWFTGERARQEVRTRRMPLREIAGWHTGEHTISRADGRFFDVAAVRVEGAGREVAGWSQPIIEPVGTGVVGFAHRVFDGVGHVLVHARIEGGFLDTAELAPTVQCVPQNYPPGSARPRFLDALLGAPAGRVRYASVHSEEGGRFLNAESRYLIVETDEASTPAKAPPGYHWVTPGQLNWLAGHSRYVNVQARTLLAVLNTDPAFTAARA
ncbi:NDP-hexose 2,3-dehydratase family protein [Streptomyces sp. NPDC001904]|uniref:NDP-hexose 2,3-dehydratase family protein n=1 Tax=Streptomyces sp. NPDC001904 TaxID=3154531 RepID=UPI00332FC376